MYVITKNHAFILSLHAYFDDASTAKKFVYLRKLTLFIFKNYAKMVASLCTINNTLVKDIKLVKFLIIFHHVQGGRKVPEHYTCIFNKTQYF